MSVASSEQPPHLVTHQGQVSRHSRHENGHIQSTVTPTTSLVGDTPMSTRCTGKTKAGTRCKNLVEDGKRRCSIHATDATRLTRARKAELETAAHKAAFLVEFAKRGIVTTAARSIDVDRATVYRWYESDPAFALAFDDAKEQATDAMENEARRRAVDGVDKPVFQGGELVGYIREYSDTLLTKMLAANRPEKYRERASVEVTGKDGGPVQHEVTDTFAYREQIAGELTAFLAGVDASRDDGGRDAGRERVGAEGPETADTAETASQAGPVPRG